MLQAALIEFGEKGLDGARVDMIAQQSSANKQLVYHYFGSKEGLYTAVLEYAYLQYRGDHAAIQSAVQGLDAEKALRRFVDLMFRQSTAATYFARLIHDENMRGGVHLPPLAAVRPAYDHIIEIVSQILDRGVAEDKFRPGIDPREFYVSILGIFTIRITNATTLSFAIGLPLSDPKGAAESREQAFDLILRGIRTPAATSPTTRRGRKRP
ncbi:bacterial regulatory s, tetR family protein [Paraburkholderia xenovorans LB400]|uniref:Transcriptional regulator, TetR family n=1 Tax=Paraburkholderia xenovorans (strain LB400) TaxID=266265 RepID=Q13G60_PARXL|nr:TetR/AcrR family transcriptional regulator [Paraburkholderia xenovorans]ABE36929.1 transcriptional regulator, TetR family [Paraburkholderia xenovorans LB400]AIP34312.1 bacterial regulatory s, tetR family protein [Paraburkholderia xenovorans LB400]